MLIKKENSCLLMVDVQEKLVPLVRDSQALIHRCEWLLRLAAEVNVPILASEQYPNGLGSTVTSLRPYIQDIPCVSKVHFSCYHEATYKNCLQKINKEQAVLAGIETHVCILQTAMELKDSGMDVFVVADAVSSRHEIDHFFGIERLKQNGIQMVTAEMVFFEWIGKAGTPEFKKLSQDFLR